MWYVIQVAAGQEKITVELIEKYITDDILQDCFFPMREKKVKNKGVWSVEKTKLYPGYIFAVTDDVDELYIRLKKVSKLTKLLGDGNYTFIPLNEYETKMISGIIDAQHTVSLSSVSISKGNTVKITQGPLLGFEGKITRINLHKRLATVSMEFMGAMTEFNFGIDIVEKIKK